MENKYFYSGKTFSVYHDRVLVALVNSATFHLNDVTYFLFSLNIDSLVKMESKGFNLIQTLEARAVSP